MESSSLASVTKKTKRVQGVLGVEKHENERCSVDFEGAASPSNALFWARDGEEKRKRKE